MDAQGNGKVAMSTHSQGRFLGSRSAAFRKTSTSKPDELRDRSGKDVGAARNYAHEKAAVARALDAKRRREAEVEKRSKKAEQRDKETLRMAKEGLEEAKGKFVYDKPLKGHVAAMEKKDTADLKGMHDRWAGDHKDMKSNPAHSERLLAVHHVLKKRGVSVPDLPQHKNLGMVRRFTAEAAEPSGTEARVKIKNVARPDDEAPTSEKSKLSRQAEIKTKIIEEKSPMRKIDFGLPSNLIDATRSILEKKTQVDLDPETDDKEDNGDNDDDNDDEVKKESKHTTPKTDKEKKLAALAHPKDKITHKDVLVGRGVLAKEEEEQIDELKKSTLSSYIRQAQSNKDNAKHELSFIKHYNAPAAVKKADKAVLTKTVAKRTAGISTAVKKVREEVEQVDEVLSKKAPAGEWIKDFQKSDNPKFTGKSPEKRKQMALGAYYAKQRNEEVELTAEELERIEAIAAQLDEAKPTMVSSPIRGANQDQSGFGVKKSVADYTISDSKKVKEEIEIDEARGRPKKSGEAPEGDDTAKHPIQQLHKIAAAIQGNEPHFEHKDGSKTKLTKQVAKHVASIYSGLRTSQDKDDFAKGLHASRDSMMSTIKKHI